MRLALPIPEGWSNIADAGAKKESAEPTKPESSATVVSPEAEPRISLAYGPMVPAPLDVDDFIMNILDTDVPNGTRLIVERRAANQTVTGYPMLIVHSAITDAEGKVREARLTAFYAMLAHNGAAMLRVRASDEDRESASELLQRFEEPAKTLLRAAAPDFETGVCTIAALYEGLPALWERK